MCSGTSLYAIRRIAEMIRWFNVMNRKSNRELNKPGICLLDRVRVQSNSLFQVKIMVLQVPLSSMKWLIVFLLPSAPTLTPRWDLVRRVILSTWFFGSDSFARVGIPQNTTQWPRPRVGQTQTVWSTVQPLGHSFRCLLPKSRLALRFHNILLLYTGFKFSLATETDNNSYFSHTFA